MLDPKTSPSNSSSGRQDRFETSAPQLALPKGGGAIRGIGEKFAANPVTGTGSMTVPIMTSPGRSGFGPKLSLEYDSGSGNGPFGLGWQLSVPAITRKTDKGLPQYNDLQESDTFILSGAEDLVRVLTQSAGLWVAAGAAPRTLYGNAYAVTSYRPRVEGLFARIERWANVADAQDTFWRSISKDNITSWYGVTADSRVADPFDAARIFKWLICTSHDGKGNVISYQYKAEDSQNVDVSQVQERNRNDVGRSANRYIKGILYGNRTPYMPDLTAAQPAALPSDWCFEVAFDYGEHDRAAPLPDVEVQPWPARHDPFSSYRSTFEVRTYRRCQRVLMFHHFPDDADVEQNCLVHSVDFTYSDPPADPLDPIYSFLTTATQTGYRRNGPGYLSQALPPVAFEYTRAAIDPTVRDVDPISVRNLPCGLDENRYRWIDLDGEGTSGILSEQGGAWFYKSNWSPASFEYDNGELNTLAQFGPSEPIATQPALAARPRGRQQLVDLAGDGHLDLVEYDGPDPGFYERTADDGWDSFTPFPSLPALDWNNPNARFVDLTGDGFPDLLISEDDTFWWYESLAKMGFGPAQRVQQSYDEETGPKLLLADGTESIFLADMSGDGLTDLVRIRNGEACYWPNLGYGRFGAKVSMNSAPWFEPSDLFDGRRIRLADIDGSGTVDLIYLATSGVQIYFNDSGNKWCGQVALNGFPAVDSSASVNALDLLGTGTACLVWSSPLPASAVRPLRFIDLMGGQKPHLLVRTTNNLGAETRVQYAPSTKFYVADKLAGTPWVTRIPFPVHVVEQVETFDWVSRNYFVTRYAYHHGYFDGVEREFRGFGMVEQWDTEEYAALAATAGFPQPSNIDQASHVPPVFTKTWFHTGAYFENARISRVFKSEYFSEGDPDDPDSDLSAAQIESMQLADTILPTTLLLPDGSRVPYVLTAEEAREACRALKGGILRQEVYALDDTDASDRPYVVSERNYTIEALQPQGPNLYGVFFTHARESIDFHYERALYDLAGRQLADPRVSHAMTLEVDLYGNVTSAVAIGYGRRHPDATLSAADQATQAQLTLTATRSEYTAPIDQDDVYRAPLPAEVSAYELIKCTPQSNQPDITNLFGFDELTGLVAAAGDGAHDLPYEDWQAQGATQNQPYRRLLNRLRTLYLKDDLSGPLPLGQFNSLALAFESYQQAFTPGLLTAVYGGKIAAADLASALESVGEYRDLDGDGSYWIPSGRTFFSPDPTTPDPTFAGTHFYLAQGVQDPFGGVTLLTYDADNLLLVSTQDAFGNVASVQNDYRVLAPSLLSDPNGNQAAVSFDVLGLVAGSAVMGKTSENLGDSLDGFVADLTQDQIDGFFTAADPHSVAAALLGSASVRTVYDVSRFQTTQAANPHDPTLWEPAFAATVARETHVSDLAANQQSALQIGFSYSDGFGREIQKKTQAEPETSGGPLRWIGTGWTIFNNKGKPVRQFEPFFSGLAERLYCFEFGVTVGVSPILFYDPVERAVATLNPDHTWAKVIFDPWQQEDWDKNDTVLIADPSTDADVGDHFKRLAAAEYSPTWYAQRQAGALGPAAQDAATKSALHAATPSVTHADALGRAFLSIAHNRFNPVNAGATAPPTDEYYENHVVFDVEGQQRQISDALDRVVMLYDYDMLGRQIHQSSMEAGERWTLADVAGKPIYGWDSREHQFRTTYDALQRPTQSFLTTATSPEVLVGRTVYGETLTNPEAQNQRGKVVQLYDQAGVVTTENYDFKGNLLSSQRQLVVEYKTTLDWSAASVPLDTDVFTTSTTFDALNRPTSVTTPDLSVYRPTYNESSLLETLDVNLQGASAAMPFVANIAYNAKRQRLLIAYGNNVQTAYTYDLLTFRLTSLITTRAADKVLLQDLSYTCDPVGNITQIQDGAQQTIFFNNQVVTPSNAYTYDAIYRLINATGREQIGQASQPQTTWNDAFRVGLPQPGDGQAMRTYVEQYQYDGVGNFLQLIHQAANGNWTRTYSYNDASQIEPSTTSNRLSSTAVGGTNPITEAYTHDAHGNMTAMPHLTLMQWDYRDQLQATSQQVVNDGTPETTYYVYDATGQRVRKVTEGRNGTMTSQRIYLGGYEVYREYDGSGTTVTLERETLHVMDDQARVALVETRTQGDDASPAQLVRWQFSNHLGSATLEFDDQAQIISYEEYYPYGSTSYQAMRGAGQIALKRYRYTGMERDDESGLGYHRARYYALWLGRWTSCDPTPLIDGTNLFSYVKANPILFTDPSGHGPNEQKLGKKNEKVVKNQQDAANKRRAQSGRQTVSVDRQQSVQGKDGKIIPDEVKWLQNDKADRRVIEVKGRHVDAERNQSSASRTADIEEGLEQAKEQLAALEAAGKVGKTAKATLLRVIWDSDKGKSSSAKRGEWTQEAKDARDRWVSDAQDPAERALRERVTVTTTTHDRILSATKESKARGRPTRNPGEGSEGPGGSLVGSAVEILAAIDIASDVSKSNFKGAAEKTGLLAIASTIPGAGDVLFAWDTLQTSKDPMLLNISEMYGGAMEAATGSPVAGGLTTGLALIVVSAAVSMVGMLPPDIQWGVKWAATHNSPGSLVPAGVATPFVMHGGTSGFVRSPADAYRDLNGRDYGAQ